MPLASAALALMVMLAGAGNLAPLAGEVRRTVGGVLAGVAAAKDNQLRFEPAVGAYTRQVWAPAGRVTAAFTVVQVCQPPVLPTATLPKAVPALLRSSSCPPPVALATRKPTV